MKEQCNITDPILAIILTILDCIIAIISLIGNSLIIYAVYNYRHLKTQTNYLIVAIAISDILTALMIPFYISFYYDVFYICDVIVCKIRYFFFMFSTLWSLLLTIGLSIDRYIAVLKPLHYHKIVQTKRVLFSICISALYIAIISALPFSPGNKLDIEINEECDLYYIVSVYHAALGVCAHVALTIVVTSILYWKIYREALSHKRKTPNAFDKTWETSITITMILMASVNVIALLPYVTVVMVRYGVPDESQNIISAVKKCAMVLYFTKAIANPIICALRNKGFRIAFKQMLGYDRRIPRTDFSFHQSNIPSFLPHESLF